MSGNLLVQFDEGRVGRTARFALSPTLPRKVIPQGANDAKELHSSFDLGDSNKHNVVFLGVLWNTRLSLA
jgi:hypothetical protein